MRAALKILTLLIASAALIWLPGCVSSRHVPEGKYLLDKVDIRFDSTGSVDKSELLSYLRQQPNHKIFWKFKFRLGIYNMSGKDSTRWWNRWIRRLGEAPVVYDRELTGASVEQLTRALANKGYLGAKVSADTIYNRHKRKVKVDYRISTGKPHTIAKIDYVFPDTAIAQAAGGRHERFTLREGDALDLDLLEQERDLIVRRLRNRGYYGIGKEAVTFSADTTAGSYDTELTVTLDLKEDAVRGDTISRLNKYFVRKVVYVTDYDPSRYLEGERLARTDTVVYKGLEIIYGPKKYLRPSALYECCFLRPGEPYSERDVERTYKALQRMQILKYSNIRFQDAGSIGDIGMVDAYILLTPGKSQSASVELEGTNSEGDLGVAASISYKHLNLGKGSETFSVKVRGAYESISGDLSGLIHNHYMEYNVDFGLSFPKFKFPFLRDSFKRKINATTEFNLSMSYQERPEYTRIVSNLGWSYKWTEQGNRTRHVLTPIDINYVYLPESTINFIDEIAPDNPLLRYSYEDHFIMRLGYTFYHTNKRSSTTGRRDLQNSIYTVRANVETAGNLLCAISEIVSPRSHPGDNPYKIFGIHYSQYIKGDADFGYLRIFDHRNSLALHAGLGIGYPYGNSTILPFEKRFYGGGANGVRGWAVRTLGPGSFPGSNSVSDFINQCGDIRLDLSAEYRAKLFWVIELGLFVDAGNIWTIHSYPGQPGGMFHFNKFYKQIAAAYGVGIRLDFNYFLLRFDMGMKAHNPAMGQEPWPLIHPKWSRDHSFHFSIGYPF